MRLSAMYGWVLELSWIWGCDMPHNLYASIMPWGCQCAAGCSDHVPERQQLLLLHGLNSIVHFPCNMLTQCSCCDI